MSILGAVIFSVFSLTLQLSQLHGPVTSLIPGAIGVVLGLALCGFLLRAYARRTVRRRKLAYAPSDADWLSPLAIFLGPFDGSGLVGVADFYRLNNFTGSTVQGCLAISAAGMQITPGHIGRQVLACPFQDLQAVEVIAGTKKRMLLATPGRAFKLGQVVLQTRDGRRAVLSGIKPEPVCQALRSLGARF